ncbi:MAG: prevent-host-death family protein [Sphingomonas bacterium]|uniref:type II toxin-antitoxin system Phd/YefM family antitoxin n=1 Tax=Sphingomonas bacterium TaxID=1895847 RepID=UPI00260CC60F|nr:type II toxin-antitoxin system Phd/YefM family antitoxin [Sphingomonas bacterium]MDB5705589.1 prevent-host-death family protein [Sphingomonas bacterium]
MKLFSSREFNQDVSEAKRAARVEPVFVTDRGRPTHVLMGIEHFRRITGQTRSLVDLLAMPGATDIDLAGAGDGWDRGWDRREGFD